MLDFLQRIANLNKTISETLFYLISTLGVIITTLITYLTFKAKR